MTTILIGDEELASDPEKESNLQKAWSPRVLISPACARSRPISASTRNSVDSRGGSCLRSVLSEKLGAVEQALAERHQDVLNFVVERLTASNLTEIETVELRAENAALRTRLGETAFSARVSETQSVALDSSHTMGRIGQEMQSLSLDEPLPPNTQLCALPPADMPPKMFSARLQVHSIENIPGMIGDLHPSEEKTASRVSFEEGVSSQATERNGDISDRSKNLASHLGTSSWQTTPSLGTSNTAPSATAKTSKTLLSHAGSNCSTSKGDQSQREFPVHKHFRFAVLNVWKEENAWKEGNSEFNHNLAKDMMRQLGRGSQGGTADFLDSVEESANMEKNGERSVANDKLNGDALCKVGRGPLAKYVIHPYSPRRGAWDLGSLFLVMYDTIMIPLHFFDLPESIFITFGDWVTRVFWSADIVLSFTTGFITADGVIDMRPGSIIKRYVRTWLCLDVLIVGVDWLEVILSTGGGAMGFARLGKSSRIFRIVRMVRLLRVMRMKEVLAFITERINSEKILIVAHIMKLLTIVFIVSHLIACLWYGVGYRDPDTMENWVNFYGFGDKPLGTRYAMSLHWATAQFAGGMDEVTPENPVERLYAIFVFILAFIVAAYFVSSLTSSMTQLQILGSGQLQMMSILRQFLAQNKIPTNLSMRIQRNATHTYKEQQRKTPEEDVSMLAFVSEPLRMELHFHMCRSVFIGHPFFKIYMQEYPQVMRKVCHTATAHIRMSAGDIIFNAGELPAQPKMYFLVEGTLSYVFVNKDKVDVFAGEWISEAVLWTHWMCRGDLSACSNAHLVTIDAKKFQEIVSEFSHHASNVDPRAYAQEFVKRLNRNALGISDLPTRIEDKITRHSTTANLTEQGNPSVSYSWSFGSQTSGETTARGVPSPKRQPTGGTDENT